MFSCQIYIKCINIIINISGNWAALTRCQGEAGATAELANNPLPIKSAGCEPSAVQLTAARALGEGRGTGFDGEAAAEVNTQSWEPEGLARGQPGCQITFPICRAGVIALTCHFRGSVI